MDSKGKRDFKKGITVDEGRRKREEKSVALRKDKKEEGLQKRRNFSAVTEESSTVSGLADNTSTSGSAQSGLLSTIKHFVVTDIPSLMQGLYSSDSDTQFQAIRGFRKLLSSESNPPVQACIDCQALPIFVQFLQRHDVHQLQFEAAWALTNIASTDRTRVVVDSGALPFLVQLLQSPNPDIREQSAWCLGNIAGDCAELRDIVLSLGALPALVANVANPANVGLLRNCTWALSNFCRGKPQPLLSAVSPALPVLATVLMHSGDQDAIIGEA